MVLKKKSKIAPIGAAMIACAALAGCGFDDVQFNGKIFDAIGVGANSAKPKEATVATRQPLVVPPGLNNLPEPGSGKSEQPTLADVQDYDAVHQKSKDQLQKEQAEFCKKNYELPKAQGDATVDSVEGPAGLCRGSVLTAISNINKGSGEGE